MKARNDDDRLYDPVRDEEAFFERESICLIELESENVRPMVIFDIASQAGYSTHYSRVATAAIRGDWLPLWQWCTRICEKSNDAKACELMEEMRTKIEKELEWRRLLISK